MAGHEPATPVRDCAQGTVSDLLVDLRAADSEISRRFVDRVTLKWIEGRESLLLHESPPKHENSSRYVETN
jgi:hypothetical protein